MAQRSAVDQWSAPVPPPDIPEERLTLPQIPVQVPASQPSAPPANTRRAISISRNSRLLRLPGPVSQAPVIQAPPVQAPPPPADGPVLPPYAQPPVAPQDGPAGPAPGE